MREFIDHSEFHKWAEAEWGMLNAYDNGEYEFSEAYRHCFRVARALAYGWQ